MKKHVGLGGTFDRLHKGHKEFIIFAHQAGGASGSLLIGLSSDQFAKRNVSGKEYPELIQSFDERKNKLDKFLAQKSIEAEIVPLNDIFGPTIKPDAVETLVVTEQTKKSIDIINNNRVELNLSPLPAQIFPMVLGPDGKIISSSRIRSGEINREGESYWQILEQDVRLTQQQRHFFSEPQGPLVEHPSEGTHIAVVGDASYQRFKKNNWSFDLAVIDGKEQRQPNGQSLSEATHFVTNPAGAISRGLSRELKMCIQDPALTTLMVDGEEDLSAVALVLLLPLESKVYYGQPNVGLVELTVSEELKRTFHKELSSK